MVEEGYSFDDIDVSSGSIDENDEAEDVGSIEKKVDNLVINRRPLTSQGFQNEANETIGYDDGGEDFDEEQRITVPEGFNTVLTKYRVQAEIPTSQIKDFDANKAFHGRHVALSNTKRNDNLRHLDAQDLCNIYERMPTMKHRAVKIRMRETAEFQMCRSNPEIGGFEAKIAATNIRREDVDVKQTQNLYNGTGSSKSKKKGILRFLSKNKGG